ncbi:hypothetical protein MKEN_00434600 [Mycena kentingensis (nom. inval.)]|nr:hypothetical protein MKEN_00434600 [Mycena kentingensis (nom. inval.)]
MHGPRLYSLRVSARLVTPTSPLRPVALSQRAYSSAPPPPAAATRTNVRWNRIAVLSGVFICAGLTFGVVYRITSAANDFAYPIKISNALNLFSLQDSDGLNIPGFLKQDASTGKVTPSSVPTPDEELELALLVKALVDRVPLQENPDIALLKRILLVLGVFLCLDERLKFALMPEPAQNLSRFILAKCASDLKREYESQSHSGFVGPALPAELSRTLRAFEQLLTKSTAIGETLDWYTAAVFADDQQQRKTENFAPGEETLAQRHVSTEYCNELLRVAEELAGKGEYDTAFWLYLSVIQFNSPASLERAAGSMPKLCLAKDYNKYRKGILRGIRSSPVVLLTPALAKIVEESDGLGNKERYEALVQNGPLRELARDAGKAKEYFEDVAKLARQLTTIEVEQSG